MNFRGMTADMRTNSGELDLADQGRFRGRPRSYSFLIG